MNIRDWSMDSIMQLPDCCFGRRFSICVEAFTIHPAPGFDISELAFPEKCVLWELVITHNEPSTTTVFASLRLALGDQLPTTPAMMDALEPLIMGFGAQGIEPRFIYGINKYQVYHMRNPIAAMGRRLVMQVGADAEKTVRVQVVCEVSSIPMEVPDCLLSGYLRSQ